MVELTTAMVTITADEYFDLRSKAETSLYFANQMAKFESRLYEIDKRVYELECKG